MTIDNESYSIVGSKFKSMYITPNNDHYILWRDQNDQAIDNQLMGDYSTDFPKHFESTLDQVRKDGSIFTTGFSRNQAKSENDIHLSSHSINGNFNWSKRLDLNGTNQMGTAIDYKLVVNQYPVAEFPHLFVAGNNTIGEDNQEVFLLELDTEGNSINTFQYGTSDYEEANDLLLIEGESTIAYAVVVGKSHNSAMALLINTATGDIINQHVLQIKGTTYHAIARQGDELYLVGKIKHDILLTVLDINSFGISSILEISSDAGKIAEATDIISREEQLFIVGKQKNKTSSSSDGFLIKLNPSDALNIEFGKETNYENASEHFESIDELEGDLIMAGNYTTEFDRSIFFVRSDFSGESCCLINHKYSLRSPLFETAHPITRSKIGFKEVKYENLNKQYKNFVLCPQLSFKPTDDSEKSRPMSQNKMDDQITIFPNPSSHTINISSNNNLIKDARIYSINGKEIISNIIKDPAMNKLLDITMLKNGLYFFKIVDEKGMTTTKRFVVEK